MRSVSLLLSVAVLSLSTAAFAQSEEHKHGQSAETPKAQAQPAEKPAAAPKTEAQKSFEWMRTLAGEWEAPVTVTPDVPQMRGAKLHLTMRVLSRGNSIAH
jgi:hypothetical protein